MGDDEGSLRRRGPSTTASGLLTMTENWLPRPERWFYLEESADCPDDEQPDGEAQNERDEDAPKRARLGLLIVNRSIDRRDGRSTGENGHSGFSLKIDVIIIGRGLRDRAGAGAIAGFHNSSPNHNAPPSMNPTTTNQEIRRGITADDIALRREAAFRITRSSAQRVRKGHPEITACLG